MTSATGRPKIAWLVNLFGDPTAQHEHGAAMLRALVKGLDADVIPVYCLDHDADALYDIPEIERAEYARARLHALLGEHDLPISEAVVVAREAGASIAERAITLSDAIDEADVMFTFVHSHAYSTVRRFVLGSFSEAFFERSSRPVLVLNPRASVPATVDHIVFGTDLSNSATRAFSVLLPVAKALGAKLRVEHQVTVRELSFFMQGEASRKQYDDELAASRAHAEKAMRPLLVAAEAAGVAATTVVEFESPSTTPAEGLEARAKDSDVSLICVPAHGDHKRPGNIGSTTLWLVRNATRPVLVIPAANLS